MKDFLESLEIGEEKLKLSKEEIKAIIAEAGKITNNEIEKVKKYYESQISEKDKAINDLKTAAEKAPSSKEMEDLKAKIADYESKETQRKQEEAEKAKDELLDKNIAEAIEGKKFINERTKKSIVDEIKSKLKDQSNVGKSAKELFEELVKDQKDIFASDNKFFDMPGMGELDGNKQKPQESGIKLNPIFRTYN